MDSIDPGVTGRASHREDARLVPSRAVLSRYDICDRTLDRWLESKTLNFPQPVKIRRRKYWQLSELVAWEREQARAVAGGAHV
jgi:predicted DNA-binding transcriptional regulator AlpA